MNLIKSNPSAKVSKDELVRLLYAACAYIQEPEKFDAHDYSDLVEDLCVAAHKLREGQNENF